MARVIVASVLLASMVPVVSVAAVTCSDVHVVFARGADRGVNDLDFNGFVRRDLESTRILAPATVTDYQLGDTGFNGHKYVPANIFNLAEHFFGGESLGYLVSVLSGRDELVNYLTDRSAQCPGEVYVLGGYSEGAEVMGSGLRDDLPQALRDRIAFVALFGDPKL
jgi:hypothetical protein